ncbi:MAG: hypothetical protein ACLFWD_02725 [Anaerolineales bacterium]
MKNKLTPDELLFTIGGFFGSSYQVSWAGGKLWYIRRPQGGELIREALSPSDEAWQRFWTQLDQIRVWNWTGRYENPSVLDGTAWGLEISRDDRELECSGRNAYPPEGKGPSMPKPFRRFLQELSLLLDGRGLH